MLLTDKAVVKTDFGKFSVYMKAKIHLTQTSLGDEMKCADAF